MSTFSPWPARYEIENDKIEFYLLNPAHHRGWSKAKFFLGWGFDREREWELADALFAHTRTAKLAPSMQNKYGVRLIYEGALASPKGPTPPVRSVWQVESAADVTCLITAHPVG